MHYNRKKEKSKMTDKYRCLISFRMYHFKSQTAKKNWQLEFK